MPELPEVETVRRGLEGVLLGSKLQNIEVLLERCFHGEPEQLIGDSIRGLERRGKMLMLSFQSGSYLLVHLRMTGQLIYLASDGSREGGGHPSDSLLSKLPSKHTRVILSFDNNAKLFYNDQRTFGSLKIVEPSMLEHESFLQKLGPEPWDRAFSVEYLYKTFQRRTTATIKPVLLDQHVVAGIGNIYADEALFLAGILPTRKAINLKKSEIKRLQRRIREVLERGIQYGGVSTRDYVNAEGLKGKMQEQLHVYARQGMPCKLCEGVIEKMKHAGRGTHFCASCQK